MKSELRMKEFIDSEFMNKIFKLYKVKFIIITYKKILIFEFVYLNIFYALEPILSIHSEQNNY